MTTKTIYDWCHHCDKWGAGPATDNKHLCSPCLSTARGKPGAKATYEHMFPLTGDASLESAIRDRFRSERRVVS